MRTVRAVVFAALCVVLAAGGHVMMSDTALPLWSLATAFALTGGVSWALAGVERGALAVTSAAVALQAALHVGFSLVPMAQASVPVASAPSVDASVQAADARMRELAASLVCGDSGGALSLPEARRVVAALGLGDLSFPGSRAQDPGHAEGHHDGPGDGHGGGHHEDASHDAGAAPSHAPSGPAGDEPHAAHGGADAGALDHLAHVSHGGMFAAHLLAALLSGVWLAFGERAAHQILRSVVGWLFGPLALALARVPLPCAARITPGFRRPRPLRRCFLSFCVVLRGPPVGAAVA